MCWNVISTWDRRIGDSRYITMGLYGLNLFSPSLYQYNTCLCFGYIIVLSKCYKHITKYLQTNATTNTLTHMHSKHNLYIRSQLHLSKLPKLKNTYIPRTTFKILLFLSILSSTFYIHKINMHNKNTHTHTHITHKYKIWHWSFHLPLLYQITSPQKKPHIHISLHYLEANYTHVHKTILTPINKSKSIIVYMIEHKTTHMYISIHAYLKTQKARKSIKMVTSPQTQGLPITLHEMPKTFKQRHPQYDLTILTTLKPKYTCLFFPLHNLPLELLPCQHSPTY